MTIGEICRMTGMTYDGFWFGLSEDDEFFKNEIEKTNKRQTKGSKKRKVRIFDVTEEQYKNAMDRLKRIGL